MLSIPSNAKVFMCINHIDFRKQIGGIKKYVRDEMKLSPFSSAYFVFISRNKKSIKILQYDGQGMWLHHKKLSEGKFKWWTSLHDASCDFLSIHPLESQVMIMNGQPRGLQIQKNWRTVD